MTTMKIEAPDGRLLTIDARNEEECKRLASEVLEKPLAKNVIHTNVSLAQTVNAHEEPMKLPQLSFDQASKSAGSYRDEEEPMPLPPSTV